jgi:hypothetical protein
MQGIAEAIGGRLRERWVDAEARPVRDVDGLDRYDAAVDGPRALGQAASAARRPRLPATTTCSALRWIRAAWASSSGTR